LTQAQLTLEDVIKQHEDILRELHAVKQAATKAGSNADRANERVDRLERRLDDITYTLNQMRDDVKDVVTSQTQTNAKIETFDSKQDTFLANTWKLIFYLVIIVGGFLTILGGIVGIKVNQLPL
jgi:DNA repair ATPase RecN